MPTIRSFCTKFITCQCRECWNDLLHMKFEEPTTYTDNSGKTKNDKTLWKNDNMTHFENKFVFNDVLCPHLK